MLAAPLPNMRLYAQGKSGNIQTFDDKVAFEDTVIAEGLDALPASTIFDANDKAPEGVVGPTGVDLGSESEPNGTVATADPLSGSAGRIKGNLWNSGPALVSDGTDTDIYSITTGAPNAKIFASAMTSFGGGLDTTIDILASDGTTVLESDIADGTFGGTAASIAGTNLATPGTYYIRVVNASATSPVAPYDLYFAVKTGSPVAEVEPNNNGGTSNPVPASGYLSGAVATPSPNPDNDTYSVALGAGDTVFVSVDGDPERDNVQWNPRLGVGLFGTPANFLVVNDVSVGSATNPLSEAFFITAKTAGTYVVYIDEPAGLGSPTATYNVSVTVIPKLSTSCTTYTNATSTPLADVALTSSTINVPGSPLIKSARVSLDITHPLTADLDVNLVSPAGNDNGLFTDVATVNTQTVHLNLGLDDNAGTPMGNFTVNSGMVFQPEIAYRLGYFTGENAGGNWRLDIRDDLAANTGTLNSWSLEICEDTAPAGSVVYSQDFEASNGGYTHSGTLDEWEYGTPNTAATTTSPPQAAIIGCASGTNCWKTDLDGGYDLDSSHNLVSPTINLTGVTGPINLSWMARYQMESVSFDRIWVQVTEVGNPTNNRIVWHANNATMNNGGTIGSPAINVPQSAGWALFRADISDFANKQVQLTFHLDGDNSIVYSGWAIDDVIVRGSAPAAVPSTIIGKLEATTGRPVASAWVTLTEQNGTKHIGRSNSFGYFTFFGILSLQNVTISVDSKRYAFSDNTFALNGDTSLTMVGVGTP